MRATDLTALGHANEDLGERVATWREDHPDGNLEDAVRDLCLWRVPQDPDPQRLVWRALREHGDPAALAGFGAMRAQAARRAGPRASRSAGRAAGTQDSHVAAPCGRSGAGDAVSSRTGQPDMTGDRLEQLRRTAEIADLATESFQAYERGDHTAAMAALERAVKVDDATATAMLAAMMFGEMPAPGTDWDAWAVYVVSLRAELAEAEPVSCAGYDPEPGLARLLTRLQSWPELSAGPEASAVDCEWPKCKTTDSNGEDTCSKGYPCTRFDDRVARRIEDPAPEPIGREVAAG